MIEVNNLELSLGTNRILRNVSFCLDSGQNLIIIGRSGSGKTVLIKTLMGFFMPDDGDVLIDGVNMYASGDVRQLSVKQKFAMVFQNAALLDSFTVFQNVALPLYERGATLSNQVREKVEKCLSLVGLDGILDKFPAEISGGMRKRVGLARALVYDPDYIIFDEPVSGLDPITSSEVMYYIKQIIDSVQATTVTITHDIRHIDDIADMILFLEDGTVQFFGSLAELRSNSNPIISKYLLSAD